MFEVEWTGSGFCLCCGEWIIKKNGVDVSNKIPVKMRENPMNTYGKYYRWYFNNWIEEWETYEDGLVCDDWISANSWIDEICDNYDECVLLFNAINAEDWRYSSCGGCI